MSKDLIRLSKEHSNALLTWPTPTARYCRPPARIHLESIGETVAAELHQRYRGFVSLQVGHLHYPERTTVSSSPVIDADRTLADPTQLHIEPVEPLMVRSGFGVRGAVWLTNLTDSPVSVLTNGNITGVIIDGAGVGVGSSSGPQIAPLIIFTAKPGASVKIPLLIGTDSCAPELGYAIPAGDWHVVAPLDLSGRMMKDRIRLISPPLPLRVTA